MYKKQATTVLEIWFLALAHDCSWVKPVICELAAPHICMQLCQPLHSAEPSWVPWYLLARRAFLSGTKAIWEHPEVVRQRKTWLLSDILSSASELPITNSNVTKLAVRKKLRLDTKTDLGTISQWAFNLYGYFSKCVFKVSKWQSNMTQQWQLG